jgi:hypothetical protein
MVGSGGGGDSAEIERSEKITDMRSGRSRFEPVATRARPRGKRRNSRAVNRKRGTEARR